MKDIKAYINESVKFDYLKDVIEYVNSNDVRVPKKYIKSIDTKYYRKDFLEKYFGLLNQWLDKNVKNIVKEVIGTNGTSYGKVKLEDKGLDGDDDKSVDGFGAWD